MIRKPTPTPSHDPAQTLACLVADLEAMADKWVSASQRDFPAMKWQESQAYVAALATCAIELRKLLSKLPAMGKGKQ